MRTTLRQHIFSTATLVTSLLLAPSSSGVEPQNLNQAIDQIKALSKENERLKQELSKLRAKQEQSPTSENRQNNTNSNKELRGQWDYNTYVKFEGDAFETVLGLLVLIPKVFDVGECLDTKAERIT